MWWRTSLESDSIRNWESFSSSASDFVFNGLSEHPWYLVTAENRVRITVNIAGYAKLRRYTESFSGVIVGIDKRQ